MDKNIILLHLESLNNIIYRMNPHLFPNIMHIEKEGLSFRKYFSTATSTWMVISDMLYGGLNQYERCHELAEKQETFCYKSGLLDDFYDKGYQIGAFIYPFFTVPQMREQMLFGRNVEQNSYASYSEFYNAFKAVMTGQNKYCILISSFLSNISCNSYVAPGYRRTGTQRWEDGYRCLDNMVGGIFQILKETGQEENTVVVLYGDHGDDFWGHGYHMGLTHAIEPTAPLIHVPLIIWEKNRHSGEVSSSLVSTIDIKEMIGRVACGERPESDFSRSFAYARSALAAQPVRGESFNKSYSVTDGKTLMLVSSQGLEMYDIEIDPACNFNMLHLFEMTQNRIVFNENDVSGFRFHFADFMDENEKRYIRQKFYFLRPQLYQYVAERYEAGKRSEAEMNCEMCFGKINHNMKW